MEEPFKYGSCLLFLTTVWLELPSDSDAAVLLKPLNHSEISSIQELEYIKKHNKDYFKFDTYRTLLSKSIVDTRNLIGFNTLYDVIQQLPSEDIEFLYNRLIEISSISRTQLDSLSDMLDIQFNPQFSEDSWDCTICQKKKLDYSRACGYLPKDKRDPKAFLPAVNGRRFTQCPISTLDGFATSQASMAHSLFTNGVLPEPGGLGNQTEWFVRAALLYKRKLAEAESAAMEAHKTK